MISESRIQAAHIASAGPSHVTRATDGARAAKAVLPSDRAELSAPASERPSPTASASVTPASLDALRAQVAVEAASLEKKLPPHRDGEVIVKVRSGTAEGDFAALTTKLGLQVVEKFDIPESMRAAINGDMYLLKGSGLRTSESIALLGRDPQIAYAASNDVLHLVAPTETTLVEAPPTVLTVDPTVPNDLDSRLWGLHNTGENGGKAGADIHATEAWSIHTGKTKGPIVAVIDTGIDYTHPELARNMWRNPDADAPDRHGYNFANDTPDPRDDHNHGTHCAGTIAAEGNNGQGIVGVNWRGRLMGLKFLDANGSGDTADAIRAQLYATAHGARVTSNSWGGGGFNQALYDTLKASPALHVFAAGNNFNDNDLSPFYPASYDLDNIISVAASDPIDRRTGFSNWGRRSVDIGAPGKDILSTVKDGGYALMSGTSMATPHVAGVAALVASRFPGITNEQIKSRILGGVDHLFNWEPYVSSGGRLNALNALEVDDTAPAAPANLNVGVTGPTLAQVRWMASGDDGMEGNATAYEVRWSELPISENGGEGAIRFSDAWPVSTTAPQAPGTAEQATFAIAPSGTGRTLHVGVRVRDNLGNTSPLTLASVAVPAAHVQFEGMGADAWTPQAPWTQADEPGRGRIWTSSLDPQQDNGADVSLRTRTIDLSQTRSSVLYFSTAHNLEEGFDFLHVEVSDDAGAHWSDVAKLNGKAEWEQHAIDLSAYDGKNVMVRFRVKTDDSIQSRPVKLKDVVVAGEAASAP